MKYVNTAQFTRVDNTQDQTVLLSQPTDGTRYWFTPASGVTLDELKAAIAFIEANPLGPTYADKVKNAPIGARAVGHSGNRAFFLKIAKDKWYFYESNTHEQPAGSAITERYEYTDSKVSDTYSSWYTLVEDNNND